MGNFYLLNSKLFSSGQESMKQITFFSNMILKMLLKTKPKEPLIMGKNPVINEILSHNKF